MNSNDEYIIENVEKELVQEGISKKLQANPFSQAVLDILLNESKKKNEEEMDDKDIEEQEDEENLEETKKESESSDDDEEDIEEQEDEEDLEETKKESESSDDDDDEEDDDEEDDDEEDDDDDDEEDDKEMVETPKTKAGILNAAFDQMKGMKKHELKQAYSEMDMTEEEEEPKLKADMINAMYNGMKKMNKENLMASYQKLMAACGGDHEKEMSESFTHDLKILMNSETNLTEGFKSKASTLFEAAVSNRVFEIRESLESQYAESLKEEVNHIRESLIEKIDDYLTYVAESWVEDNKEYVDAGLRTEITESFMRSLQNVFTEHYIAVPENKRNLVDELTEELSTVTEALNKSENRYNELNEQVETLIREKVFREQVADLTSTQSSKLQKLIEDVRFTDAESYANKVKTIKESYFAKGKSDSVSVNESYNNSENTRVIVEGEQAKTGPQYSSEMKAYLRAISSINENSHR